MPKHIEIIKIKGIDDIKPLVQHTCDPNDVLGGKLFLDPYSNTAIISKKKSGKSTCLYHILKNVCRGGKFPTNVIIFSPTHNKDTTYKHIFEMLEKKGCNVSAYSNFIEDGENIVDDLLDEVESDKPDVVEPVDNKITLGDVMFGKNEVKKVSKSKPKKLCADYVLVFDDLGSLCRHPSLEKLVKRGRHSKIRTFFLQQYLTDLSTGTRKNLDYALIFRSFNEEKLKNLYESLDLSVDFEDFLKLYEYATKEPYNFLYIDRLNEKYRKNFNTELILND